MLPSSRHWLLSVEQVLDDCSMARIFRAVGTHAEPSTSADGCMLLHIRECIRNGSSKKSGALIYTQVAGALFTKTPTKSAYPPNF